MPTGSEDGCIVIIVVDTMAQEFITNMSAGRGGCVCEKGGGGRWEGGWEGEIQYSYAPTDGNSKPILIMYIPEKGLWSLVPFALLSPLFR